MMVNRRSPILSGGVSTQPDHLRFPDQVGDAENALFVVGSGAAKRPGTALIEASNKFTANRAYRTHGINRDGDEKYLVVIGRNAANTGTLLEVFSATTGEAATMTVTTDAQTYLDAGSPVASDFRLKTVGDTTFIVNPKATPAVGTTPAYSVPLTRRNYDALLAYTPAADAYVRTLEDVEGELAGHYQYTLQEDNSDTPVTFAKGRGPTVGEAFAIASQWANQATAGGFTIFFQRVATDAGSYSWDHTTLRLTKTGAFTNYTGAQDDQINVTGGTGVTADSYPIKAKIDNNTIELFNDIASATSPSDVTVDGIGLQRQVEASFTSNDPVPLTMDDVAQRWQDGLRAAGVRDGLVSWVPVSGTRGYFEITGPYRGAGSKVQAPTAPANATLDYTNLSTQPFHTGSWTGTDGAGVASEVDASQSPESRWTRVAAPSQAQGRITATTMPVLLTRTNGTPMALAFRCDVAPWKDRLSGDQNSNPAPRAITDSASGITDVAFFRNRLWFCSGEFVSGSADGDLFNFFVTDPANIADDDTIDAQVSSEQFTAIDHMVEFNRSLTLFTFAGRQFDLTAQGAMTPSSVTITPSTRYDTKGSRPVVMGPFLYFLTRGQDATDVYEYVYDETIVGTAAASITRHVNTAAAKTLPADLSRIEAAPGRGTVVAFRPGDDDLYVWRGSWNGTEKVQSAWCRWSFADYTILDASEIDGDLVMLVSVNGAFAIESLPLDPPEAQVDSVLTSSMPWPAHMDRQMWVTGVYDAGQNETTFDLQSVDALLVADESEIDTIIYGSTFGASAGTQLTDTHNWTFDGANGDIVVPGDHAGLCLLGRRFTMSLTLTRPIRSETPGGPGVLSDAAYTRQTVVEFDRTGVATVTATQTNTAAPSRSRVFNAGGVAVSGGTLRTQLGGKTTTTTTTVTSTDARPCVAVAVEHTLDVSEGMVE